jgi:uncharacterized protein (TIGR03084 family)
MSLQSLATTRLAECWAHGDDVAEATGRELPPTDRLEQVARLAWRTLPYAFARAGRRLTGPVTFDLRAPSGARWHFADGTSDGATTVVTGDGVELCLVAAQRRPLETTSLRAVGPDADAVLALVRTYA